MKCGPLLSPQSYNYSLSWYFTFTELKIALYCSLLKHEMCIWKADSKSLSQFFKNKWFISYYVLDPDVLMIYLRVIETLAGNIKINEWKNCINQPIKTIKIRAYGWYFSFFSLHTYQHYKSYWIKLNIKSGGVNHLTTWK